MIKDYLSIALSSIKKRRIRSFLTMIGIFIGIAAVVGLISLGEGLRLAITSQFAFVGTDILSVQSSSLALAGPPGVGAPNPLTDDLADKIAKLDNIEAAINRYIKTGTLEFNDIQEVGLAMSMPSGDNRKVIEKMLNVKAEQGRLLKDGDTRKVFLGNSFTNQDVWGRPIKAGDRVLISGFSYQVIGIMKKKGSFFLDGAVMINEATLLKDFGDDGTVNIIGVKVKDEKKIGETKTDIEKLLRKERDVKKGEENFEVESPQQTLEALDSTLFAVQLFITIIASISLLVGGIGITNTMYTSILERTKDIGIMKSIGARNSSIFILFFIESGFMGLTGGLIGIIIGLIMAYGLAAIARAALGISVIQAHASIGLILGSLAFSFIIGLIAGLTPAIQAAKKTPVEALRFAK